MRGPPRSTLVAALIASLFAACGGTVPSTSGQSLAVVTTTTVFADLAAQVGGDRVTVTSLVPAGGEVHTFDPTPAMATRVAQADLVFMNGLGLDDWLGRLVQPGSRAHVVRLGEDLPGVDYITTDGATNPHLWLDVAYAEGYAERIGAALADEDPAGAVSYGERTQAYVQRLRDLDAGTRSTFEAIPAEQRRIVAFHDALPYFARAYGLEIVGVIVPAPGQETSASYVAALIDEIRRTGARAIISEVQFSPSLAQTIAAESGATVVSDLYDDTLGDPPLDTYEGMIRWDVERIASAVR